MLVHGSSSCAHRHSAGYLTPCDAYNKRMTPDREKELLERIRQLEEQNSALQDKLDLIYEIVSPDDYSNGEAEDEGLININLPKN